MSTLAGAILLVVGLVFLGLFFLTLGVTIEIDIIENIGLIILYSVFGLIVLSVICTGVMCLLGK